MQMTKDRGRFKQQIKTLLFTSENLLEVLCGDVSGLSTKAKLDMFNKCVKSHLFIDDTLTENGSYIFFDVVVPDVSVHTKECKIVMYLICHRDLLDDTYVKEGYYGNRADIMSEIVEETLLSDKNINQFGIGELLLESVDIYNSASYYGVQMTYAAECFR